MTSLGAKLHPACNMHSSFCQLLLYVGQMLTAALMSAVYKLHFQNGTQGPLDNFMIQFNKNSFGLAPGTQNVPVPQLAPGSSQTAVLPLVQNPALVSPTAASAVLQVRHTILM